MTAAEMRQRLGARAEPARVAVLRRFFKTGPGEYGEGDVFIGVRAPALREVCRQCRGAVLSEIRALLRSPIHEERALALLLLVDGFTRGSRSERKRIYDFYLGHTAFINSWDLVDCSAAAIVGGWLDDQNRAPLRVLAKSSSIWERRIAMIATHHFIRRGDLEPTLAIADILLEDSHDLIHKAVGWMLREAEKQDGPRLRRYLDARAHRMPRTMLRYAIERFPGVERRVYLKVKKEQPTAGRQKPSSRSSKSRGRSMNHSSPRKSPGLNR
jgi:3-methyladenine DNA glycosylase AlkD